VVSPTPTLTRSRLAPPQTRVPFRPASSPPGRPGSRAAEPPRSASFTCFEVLIPPASPFAPRRVSPPRRPMLSWLRPSTAFSAHASGPLDPPGPGHTALRPSPSVTLGLRSPLEDRRLTSPLRQLPDGGARPDPLARHAPTLPKVRARTRPSTRTCARHPGAPTRDRTRRPDHDSCSPTLGRPRLPSSFLGPWLGLAPRPEGLDAHPPRRAR
jgi:hypothetical protein